MLGPYKKHAYCIIAHNEPEVFSALLRLIDDVRNDVFVMIDKKSDIAIFNSNVLKFSNIFFLDTRVDVRWGDISMTRAELELFEFANNKGSYDYFHLLSGVDLPLKSQDYIHKFIEDNAGCEFVDIAYDSFNQRDAGRKTRYYHIFCEYFNDKNYIKKQFYRIVRKVFLMFQQFVGYKRNWNGLTIMKGSQWVSISKDFCGYLLERKYWILEKFRHVPAADELFIQTIIFNSPFRNKIWKGNPEDSTNLRAIDWERGNPYVYKIDDIESLISGKMLFARKFSSPIDKIESIITNQ
jgi:hypothetical protein